jgi:hypothetical protein
MFGRRVKCSDCGFLARHLPVPQGLTAKTPAERIERRLKLKQLGVLEPHECSRRQRADVIEARLSEGFTVFCSRHVWSELDSDDLETEDELEDLLAEGRECRLFYRYEPGYSPIEHRELHREDKTRNLVIITTLLAAAVGAAAALIGGLITK